MRTSQFFVFRHAAFLCVGYLDFPDTGNDDESVRDWWRALGITANDLDEITFISTKWTKNSPCESQVQGRCKLLVTTHLRHAHGFQVG